MSVKVNNSKLDTNYESLQNFFSKLRENKKQIILFNLVVAVLTIIILIFFIKSYYESTVTILPDFGKKPSFLQMSDLASLVGINVSEGSETNLYRNIITSETVLKPVIYSKYTTTEFAYPVNLIEFFEIDNYNNEPEDIRERKRFLDVKRILLENINSNFDKKTNILKITVKMPESKLSAEVVNNIVNSLDKYLRNKTKFNAKEQRIYIEERIKQLRDSLFKAEEKYRLFREKNRVVENSPVLILEQKRLLRDIEILQTVYAELNKHLELAKIEEVKDTPILNVMEYAADPIIKAGPPKLLILSFIILISLLFSILFAIYFPKYKQIYQSVLTEVSSRNTTVSK